jgi:hypothetical protein
MKRVTTALCVLIACSVPVNASKERLISGPGKTIACYKPIKVAPKIRVKRIKMSDNRLQYEHRNGRIELVDYPPVYKEIEEIVEPEHILLRAIPC